MAVAHIRGGEQVPGIRGTARFCQTREGVYVAVEVRGLPETESGFFGLHIHEGSDCGGWDFGNAGGHYNPQGTVHPRHAGDLPLLLGCGGKARICVLTDRFRVRDIVGKTVVIHSGPDDFRSQPAGNSGEKIACGVIYPCAFGEAGV